LSMSPSNQIKKPIKDTTFHSYNSVKFHSHKIRSDAIGKFFTIIHKNHW
jgi:hypothetical protein